MAWCVLNVDGNNVSVVATRLTSSQAKWMVKQWSRRNLGGYAAMMHEQDLPQASKLPQPGQQAPPNLPQIAQYAVEADPNNELLHHVRIQFSPRTLADQTADPAEL